MSRRERIFSMVMTVFTAVTVVALLAFNIWQTNELSEDRAAAAIAISRQNNEIIRDVRRGQVSQRDAFRALARRNEQLHGSDPSGAPDFSDAQSSNPPSRRGASGPDTDVRSRQQQDNRDVDGADRQKRAQDTSTARESERRREPRERNGPSDRESPAPPDCTLRNPLNNDCVVPGG